MNNQCGAGKPKPAHRIPRKLTKKRARELLALETVPGSVRAVSDAIRERAGLPPVPETRLIKECRALLGSGDRNAPDPLAAARELAKARAAHGRKARELDRDARELAKRAVGSDANVSAVARALGVTRQRIYQLAA